MTHARKLTITVALLVCCAIWSSPALAEPDQVLYENLPALELLPVDPDLLARGHSFRLVGGDLSWSGSGRSDDTDALDSINYTLAVDTRYFRSLERTRFGYSVLANASDALAREPFNEGVQYINDLRIDIRPEARFYPSPGQQPFFFYGASEFDVLVETTKLTGEFATDANSIAEGRFGLAVGVGYGRVLSIDPVVRLRRLEQALQGEGVLTGDIPRELGSDIIRSWYAVRNYIGNYPRLAYTMKHLSDAGMLARQPNLRATYKAIAILQDPFIFDRLRGFQARIGIGVSSPFIAFDEATAPDSSTALVGSAQYERPLSTTRQLSVRGRLFADLGDVTVTIDRPWSMRGYVTHTHAFYNGWYDPTGLLTLSAEAGISGLRSWRDLGPRAGIDLIGRAQYSRVLNGGSLTTFGGNLTVRNDGEYVLALSVGFTRGIAAGFYTPYANVGALQ